MSLRPMLQGFVVAFGLCASLAAQTVARGNAPLPARPPSGPAAPEVACGPDDFTENGDLTPTPTYVGCVTNDANHYTADNSWWRAFELSDYGLTADFVVCAVNIAVASAATPGAVGQPVTVNLYTNTGCPFPGGTRTLIGTATATVPDQSVSTLVFPVSGRAPADSELVVEVHVDNGEAQMFQFLTSFNNAVQTRHNYFSSVTCSYPDPVDMESVAPGYHLILQVVGTEQDFSPTALAVNAPGNGILELGTPVVVSPTWKNGGGASIGITGTASNLTAPAGYTPTLIDPTADYGTLTAGASADCATATGNCYQIQIDGAAGTGHRDASFDEVISPVEPLAAVEPARTRVLHIGDSFSDVPSSNLFYSFVETILHKNITGGCAGGGYCPGDGTLRKQMAVFLLKALLGSCYVPPPATGIFQDVPVSDPFAPWIENLFNLGITGGCSGGPPPAATFYCPNDLVKRQQMAVFLLKTDLGSGYVPPPATGHFTDVPISSPFAPWIEDLYNRSIATGCGAGIFCPANPVTRGQMAVFVTKTFSLLMYAP